MDAGTVVGIIGALAGLLGAVISWRTSRASARKDEVDTLRGIIAELRAQIADLEEENGKLLKRIQDLEEENLRLRRWINRLEAENARLRVVGVDDDGGVAAGMALYREGPVFLQPGVGVHFLDADQRGERRSVDTESDAASDDLDTINGGDDAGDLLVLRAENSARTVVVKDGTGNLRLAGGDFSLDHAEDRIVLQYDGTNRVEIGRANNS